jgi:hypothetical protein
VITAKTGQKNFFKNLRGYFNLIKGIIVVNTFLITYFLILPIIGCNPTPQNNLLTPVSLATEISLPEVAPQYQNQWTPELEAQFQARKAEIMSYYANSINYGNGYGENEKQSYPRAMFDFLAGNQQKAITFLQQEDPQAANHAHTDGIDYYYSFTLKGQIRKYFLFGQFLDPAYKQRMFNGAKKWTEEDPLTRPHPIYGRGDGSGRDWDIQRRGLWVDSRNTDNLRAMRETSVYLMAEETGNEATRQIYQQKIQRYVWALYHIGMGEWDSEVYHGHNFAPYLNLYDFAKDPEVKLLAKAALDWMSTAAAVKYYRGGWGGPVKRDYGSGNVALGSSAARTFWLYFGDTPLSNPNPELDTLYLITSTYRPPLAVVALAQKKFSKPVEIFSSKPVYENWKPGYDTMPGYWETQFFGESYQMGSLAGSFPDGDVAPFKLLAYNSQRGVDYFVANTGGSWVQPGKKQGDQIGQYQNLLIWLRPADQPFFFQLPQTAKMEIKNGVWFFKLEKTWLAIHPLNLNSYSSVQIDNERYRKAYPQELTLQATPLVNKNYAGFILEVGEEKTKGSYQKFKFQVIKQSKINLSQINQGKVELIDSINKSLRFFYNQENLLPMIYRNSKLYDWSKNWDLYKSMDKNNRLIALQWKQGKLRIEAGGYTFITEVNANRTVVTD